MSAQHAPHTPPLWRRVLSLPQTRLGWWAIGLAATFVVLLIFGVVVFEILLVDVLGMDQQTQWEGVVLPFYSITALLSGLCGGVVGLIALLRQHERSWLVWLALVPGLAALVFFIGEFLHKW
jgi:hypothetical protein